MPIARVQTPDGRVMRIQVPDGATSQQIQDFAQSQFEAQQAQVAPAATQDQPAPGPGFGDIATGTAEVAATIGSGIISEPLAGIAGVAQSINPFSDPGAGARAVEATRQALTFQPRTEEGRGQLSSVGEALEPIGQAVEAVESGLGDFAFELTGSPVMAAAAASTPTLIAEALGLGAIKKARSGTRLLTQEGRPTKKLESILDKEGLDFDNLTQSAREQIPEVAEKGVLGFIGESDVAGAAEKTLIEQIKAGGSDDSLATLMVSNNRIKPDKVGSEAVRQGFEPGLVQLVKTTSPSTKSKMKKMLNITKRTKKNLRVSQDVRPTDAVGDAATDRIKFIRDSANSDRIRLDEIAKNDLGGKSVDFTGVIESFNDSLGDLDIDILDSDSGIPKPEFKGSLISKDRTSQKIIKDLISLMSEGGAPDALRLHKMKRQLDSMIDFRKKSAGGLTDAGRNVLKNVRSSINNSIRDVSAPYAAVNDRISSALTSLDDFKNVAGSTIDIFGKGSNKAIGQDLRGLMSNRKSRVNLENAVDTLDSTAKKLGGTFNDNIKDLASFANALDDKFGAIAKTSFKGQIESAIRGGPRDLAKGAALEKAAKGLEKLRGINDSGAFRSMNDLLSR